MKAQLTTTTWLEYDDVGKGQPVVLLHAFPLARSMWRPQVDALQNHARLIVPDLRGLGGSSPFDESPSLEQMADDVAGLLEALKLSEPVVLGGLSMGGYIALAVVRKYPAQVRALVLADTRAEADNTEGKANRDKLIAFARNHSSREFIDLMLPKMVSAETRSQRPEVVEEIRRIASAQTPGGIIGALQVLRDRPEASSALGGIRVPTLVMVGTEDEPTPPAVAEILTTGIHGARLVRIAGAGHLSNLERPELFNAVLGSFLRSLAAG